MHIRQLSLAEQAAEWLRPWKLASLAIGMGWLLYGALNYNISDWDVGISLLMGGLTYLLAPWSLRTILYVLRYRPLAGLWQLPAALFAAWFVVDGIYVFYHSLMGNVMLRMANLQASMALYFLAGAIWLYAGSLRELVGNLRQLSDA